MDDWLAVSFVTKPEVTSSAGKVSEKKQTDFIANVPPFLHSFLSCGRDRCRRSHPFVVRVHSDKLGSVVWSHAMV